jgi:hypothetical protein
MPIYKNERIVRPMYDKRLGNGKNVIIELLLHFLSQTCHGFYIPFLGPRLAECFITEVDSMI